ncbi:MAG: Rieske 2Fe-2S domain-containing protein [Xanthobacteraceae bacterium]
MSWKRVCKAIEVPENSLRKFTVDGVTLVVANYGSGFRAIPPLCPHMEEPLEESGVIAECALTCTKHLWSWDLSSLDMLGETERPLKTYEVKLENGDILAFIDKELVYEFEDADDVEDDDFFSKA